MHRLPPAANLPPVSGLPAPRAELRMDATPPADIERSAQDQEEDRSEDEVSRVLDPRRLLPPRSVGRRPAGGLKKLLIASALAVPPAYFIANAHSFAGFDFTASPFELLEARLVALLPAPRPSRSQLAHLSQRVAVAPTQETAALTPVLDDKAAVSLKQGDAETVDAPPPALEPRPAVVAALPVEGPRESAAPAAPPGDSAQAVNPQRDEPAPARRAPAPSAQEIALLTERGRAFFEAGDMAAARLLFRRAANAGDAAAALAMGATYDPVVLSDRQVRGLGADSEQARSWYEKARELGSPEGPHRLEMLAHR
jgi:hypothetical protein